MRLKYAAVFEQTPNNYSAYVPDLPGCISTGESLEHTRKTIREATSFHIEAMLDLGEPLSEPKMSLEEAESHHDDVLAEYDDTDVELPAKFGIVEVEVDTRQSARTG